MLDTHVTSLSNPNPALAWRMGSLHSCPRDRYLWTNRGQTRAVVAGRHESLGLNSLLFVPAGEMTRLDLPIGSFCVLIETDVLAQLRTPEVLRVGEVTAQKDVAGLIENIREETGSPNLGFRRATQAHVLLLEVWISRMLQNRPRPPKAKASRKVSNAFLKNLEAEFSSSRSPQHYAQQLGITPTHLSRATRSSLGQAASQIVIERKIHAAKTLLADTRIPIAEIANSLGFSSAGYFTRSFQNFDGQSPTLFRKKARELKVI